jgi:hypothetical protein
MFLNIWIYGKFMILSSTCWTSLYNIGIHLFMYMCIQFDNICVYIWIGLYLHIFTCLYSTFLLQIHKYMHSYWCMYEDAYVYITHCLRERDRLSFCGGVRVWWYWPTNIFTFIHMYKRNICFVHFIFLRAFVYVPVCNLMYVLFLVGRDGPEGVWLY